VPEGRQMTVLCEEREREVATLLDLPINLAKCKYIVLKEKLSFDFCKSELCKSEYMIAVKKG
jgi:hypothetical protein